MNRTYRQVVATAKEFLLHGSVAVLVRALPVFRYKWSRPDVYPRLQLPRQRQQHNGFGGETHEIRHDSRSVTATVMGLSKLTIDMISPPLSPIETVVSSRCQTQLGHR
ncbi:hypothetical protein GCM10022627_18870 [Haloarcula argentinensis]|uniref:Uncharacterized protein n=1 Tax=Haloarcula argentinensis TaxID=43776 RepID=A0A830FGX1_HALAR|nr:hypothetical protein GCM10009006_00520 [Haloarcula argentinensis]